MTADEFRRLILAHRDVVEGAHMGHPDFRVNGKVVASLHPPKGGGDLVGMVKVTPDEQAELLREHPDVFEPEAGAWGRQGCTRVLLTAAGDEIVGPALTMAVQLGRKAPRRRK